MKIHHIAIWADDLETMKDFYVKFFNLSCGDKYYNPEKKFSSYFLSFDSGAQIEIMHHPDITLQTERDMRLTGLTHFAISVGSKEKVNELTERIRNHGFKVIGEPRITGDGFYESVVSDPEGNRLEITI